MDLCKHIFHISCTLKCCPLSHYHKVELPQSFSHFKKKTSRFFWLRRCLRLGRALHQGNKCPIASIPGNWNGFLGCFRESTRYKYVLWVFLIHLHVFCLMCFKIHRDVLWLGFLKSTLTFYVFGCLEAPWRTGSARVEKRCDVVQ